MKITISKATVSAVTLIVEKHGKGKDVKLVDGTSITITGQVPAPQLAELDPKLPGLLFKDDIPAFPQLGAIEWTPQYEGATGQIGGIKFAGAGVKKITFTPLPGFIADIGFTVKVMESSDELNKLLRREVKVKLEKMTQVEIREEDDDEDGEGKKQGKLLDEPAKGTDGKPIQPLMKPAATTH